MVDATAGGGALGPQPGNWGYKNCRIWAPHFDFLFKNDRNRPRTRSNDC